MKSTFKSKFSKNRKLTAIRNVKKLMKRGYSLSNARRHVSKTLNVVPSTLYNWERELTGKVTTANHVTSKTVTPVTTTVTNGNISVTEIQIRNNNNETLTFHRNDVNMLRNVLDAFNTK